jgi:1,2-phenylacetyl-CoA epoxidase catalytic subunit
MIETIEDALNFCGKRNGYRLTKFDWNCISSHDLSEDFMREFQNKINWQMISQYQKLSEGFIREFQDKLNWFWISMRQVLSESFIREFQEKLWWGIIPMSQELSEDFKDEFQDRLSKKKIENGD